MGVYGGDVWGKGVGNRVHMNPNSALSGKKGNTGTVQQAMSYFVGCNAVDEGISEDAGFMRWETNPYP